MRRLSVFNSVTADGYFTGDNGDLSWAHKQDPEWNSFVAENSESEGQLLFGRVTYEMMAGFWPTAAAAQAFPVVAEQMNKLSKVVFSKNLDKATWNNTQLLKGDLVDEVRKLKEAPGPHMVIMGSGTIVSQLTWLRTWAVNFFGDHVAAARRAKTLARKNANARIISRSFFMF